MTISKQNLKKFHVLFYHKQDKIYQDNFLVKCMEIKKVTRHRVTTQSPVNFTAKYFVTTAKGRVPVCLRSFIQTLDVPRFRLNRLLKEAGNDGCPAEKRGGFQKVEEYENKRTSIIEFLQKLPYKKLITAVEKTVANICHRSSA